MAKFIFALGIVLAALGSALIALGPMSPRSVVSGIRLGEVALPVGAGAAIVGVVLLLLGLIAQLTKASKPAVKSQALGKARSAGLAPTSPKPRDDEPASRGRMQPSAPSSNWPAGPLDQPTPMTAVASAPTVAPSVCEETSRAPLPGIQNGCFEHWSKGERFEAIGGYQESADCWLSNFGDGGAGSVTVSKVAATGDAIAATWLRFEVTRPGRGQGWCALSQVIEDVRTFAGKSVKVSLCVRASTDLHLSVSLDQIFGTDGERSVQRAEFGPLSLAATRVSASFQLPPVAMDAARAGSHLIFSVLFPTEGTFWVELGDVSVDEA